LKRSRPELIDALGKVLIEAHQFGDGELLWSSHEQQIIAFGDIGN
jgi:hypothetical protein